MANIVYNTVGNSNTGINICLNLLLKKEEEENKITYRDLKREQSKNFLQSHCKDEISQD